MYTVYKMKNELGEEVELVEKKEFDKVLERNREGIKLLQHGDEFGCKEDFNYQIIEIPFDYYDKLLGTLQGKEGASKGE